MSGLRGPSAMLRLQSDERLIALTRRGNHAAFEVLCARYQSRLLSFCRHMLASREDAEDVLQEVFTAAFNAVLADEREINVKPWLYRIARNRSLNHLRRASATGVDSMDIHFAEHGTSTSDKVIKRESFRELIGDVHELPETQRTALLLREIDALSYDQIAVAMDTTVPSVKSLLVRARISLAEAAEARKLSCEDVRLELGEAAEGLAKLSSPARRHVRDCERCLFFKKQLKENNRALAAILPIGPMLLLRKLIVGKIGSASAGGAHAAGAGAGASASIGAGATATAGVGVAASGGASVAGGLLTAGAGAIATKAVAGLAAAAIVAAGAVAADHAATSHHHSPAHAAYVASTPYVAEPVVVHQVTMPPTGPSRPRPKASAARRAGELRAKAAAAAAAAAAAKSAAAPVVAAAAPAPTAPSTPVATPVTPAAAPSAEVTSEGTSLPSSATEAPATTTTPTTTTPATTTPTGTTPPPVTTSPSEPIAEPVTPPAQQSVTVPVATLPAR